MSQEQAPSKEQLVAWLEQHPEVLLEAPQLLSQLDLPTSSNGTSSLLERQNQKLREQVAHYQERLHELIAVAKENDRLFAQTRQLVLALIEAETLEQLTHGLHITLKKEFQALTSTLLLFTTDSLPTGEYQQTTLQALHEDLQLLINRQTITSGSFRDHELTALFGESTETVASAVLIPLHFEGLLGVLAIGSEDPLHFRSSLDTLFVEYIGACLSRKLHQLLPATQQHHNVKQVAQ